MARPTQKSIELGELIRLSEASRRELGQAHAKLKRSLDVPSRIKESLKFNPTKWLSGSLAAGFICSFLLKSKNKKSKVKEKKAKKERGFILGLVLTLFTLSKPAVKVFAVKLLKDYFNNQLSRGVIGRARSDSRALN